MSNEKKEFNVGDLIVVCDNSRNEEYYSNGDIGKCIGPEKYDFSGQGNLHVYDKGQWFAKNYRVKHYTQIKDLPLWKSNHMYLNDEQQQALRKLLHRVQWDEEYAEKIGFFYLDRPEVDSAFSWTFTDEGYDFWNVVYEKCWKQEIQQPVIPDEVREEIKSLHHFAECSIVDNEETVRTDYTSEYFLQRAIDLQKERGKEYDNGQERSMGKIVEVFNIITGKQLSESEGWLFMQVLKDVRQWTKPEYHQDSAEDCVSYAALKAEALASGK